MGKIFNPYKQKRKLGRAFKKATGFVFEKDALPRDFDWHERKVNPYKKERTNWKVKFRLIILFLLFILTLSFLIYHPYFHISSIKVTGLQRINEQEFKSAVQGVINCQRFLIFPGNNYFLINEKELQYILNQRFSFENIVIDKSFPHDILFVVQEKVSTLIYDNGKNYSYLGADGLFLETLRLVGEDEWQREKITVTSTNELGQELTEEKIISQKHSPPVKNLILEFGDYPIVYDSRGLELNVNTPILPKELASGIIQWFNFLNKSTNIKFNYVFLDNDRGEGIIHTGDGWLLKINLEKDLEIQYNSLQYLLQNKKIDINNLNYIDLRFPGRIFWQ